MARIVVDSSALVEVLVGQSPSRDLRQRILTSELNAPELCLIEVLNVLRRREMAGLATAEQAERAVWWLARAPVRLAPHRLLVPRIWEMRPAVTAYDATYVALAEHLAVPLVTTDAKLGGSNGHKAQIELYPAS
ncbi:type II toxin-antitoxin system VapC family toxin [Amycolatopsis nigrescens]|uniref:type II toxin-antitoxin system VapC family toxin n=1 Tax=Amycolatopsis nigrescens TaxID=381445 RepID=UPI0003757685|nr:type II toxin-antitoxin system VapC family toxin [Amycolatopsis nigrescens]